MNFALPNMPRAVAPVRYQPTAPVRRGWLRPLSRIRYQLLGGLFFAVFLPALFRSEFDLRLTSGSLQNSVLATAIAVCVAAYAVRKMMPFPGVQATAFILPYLHRHLCRRGGRAPSASSRLLAVRIAREFSLGGSLVLVRHAH